MASWIVVFTQPHKECLVETTLHQESIGTYLPFVRPKRIQRNRSNRIPFFPRYLFASRECQSLAALHAIQYMPGVQYIVSFGGRPAVVGQEVIDLIRARLAEINEHGFAPYHAGERVRITSGPLMDLEAIFDRPMSAKGRVRILIEVLGHLTPCEVDSVDLERVIGPA